MPSEKSDGGSAFPEIETDMEQESSSMSRYPRTYSYGGMTLRQYAAIKLGVPDSGIDWLDEMIRKAGRPKENFYGGPAEEEELTERTYDPEEITPDG